MSNIVWTNSPAFPIDVIYEYSDNIDKSIDEEVNNRSNIWLNQNSMYRSGVSSSPSKSILKQHVSFRNKHNYSVVNELESGSYFGEISMLTNLPVTASVHTASAVVCGRISKQSLMRFLDVFATARNKIYAKLYKYNDAFFRMLIKIIRNIPDFKNLSHYSAKSLVFKMQRMKYRRGHKIIRFRELKLKTFFIYSGIVWVYVIDPDNKKRYPFQYLKEGSSFNFSSWIHEYSSLFEFSAESDSIIMEIHKDDIKEVANKDKFIYEVIR